MENTIGSRMAEDGIWTVRRRHRVFGDAHIHATPFVRNVIRDCISVPGQRGDCHVLDYIGVGANASQNISKPDGLGRRFALVKE